MSDWQMRFRWSRLDLFRFSAATGNAHRIHYDVEHARREGLDSVVVHTTLHAMMLWRTVTQRVEETAVETLAWRNHAPLYADEPVEVRASGDDPATGGEIQLEERALSDDRLVASGHATIRGAAPS